jgi:hypothetical protein
MSRICKKVGVLAGDEFSTSRLVGAGDGFAKSGGLEWRISCKSVALAEVDGRSTLSGDAKAK